jgi:ectoine hydroxylase-related dioxygenase (phytanoyl-CoA dioxygenase family)
VLNRLQHDERSAGNALDFHEHGVEIRRSVLSLDDIRSVTSEVSLNSDKIRRGGIRSLEKKFASIANLSADPNVLGLAAELLDGSPQLVRALFFDKTPEKNWFVTWHQDKTVALNQKADLDGWGPWSVKEDVWHVQPPQTVLNRMLTLRLHLDPADDKSGCLKVIPGTHRFGILQQVAIDGIVRSHTALPCVVSAGDAVVMRPHVIHSSAKSIRQSHRRVVHLEYSNYELPPHLHWA